MTNAEKFKTAKERAMAFRKFCANKICKGHEANCVFFDKLHDKTKHMCEFAWLELEAKNELLPCPFCGCEAILDRKVAFMTSSFRVKCSNCEMCTELHSFKNAAIATWNRRAK